jgi:hypothetical protein
VHSDTGRGLPPDERSALCLYNAVRSLSGSYPMPVHAAPCAPNSRVACHRYRRLSPLTSLNCKNI